MRALVASIAVLSIFHLDPCGGTTTGNGGGNAGGGNAGDNGGAAANGGANGGGNGTPSCAIFYDGWEYRTITSYEPGKDPIVGDIAGTADFNADGTFVEDYTIGTFLNHYSGTYTLDGDKLTTVDENGNGTTEYTYTCADDTKQLVLTIKYPDGSPQIITGLVARKK